MDVQFAYTILYVSDVPQTVAFYQNALGFEPKFITPEKDYGELISGATTLAFASLELGKANFQQGFKESSLEEKPFGIELAFTTKEVEQVMQRAIENGATLLEEVSEKPWGQKVGYVRDINGFILEICTPMPTQE